MVDERDEMDGAGGSRPPEADAPPPLDAFARRFAELLDASGKTQRQVAKELGYRHPNILSMFKTGVTRVPFDKVSSFAFMVGVDERELILLWLATYMPEMQQALERSFGSPLTEAERSWLVALRDIFGEQLPFFDADAAAVVRLLAKRRDTLASPDPGGGAHRP